MAKPEEPTHRIEDFSQTSSKQPFPSSDILKPTLKTAEHPRTDISKPALLTRNARYPITLVLPQLLPDVIQLRPRPVVVGFMLHTRAQIAGPQYFIVLLFTTEPALVTPSL